MLVDLQVSPAANRWEVVRDSASAAESAGFGCFWVWDHLSGRTVRGSTMLECFTLLGALAATTVRIGLGSLVVNVVNRHAGVVAVAAATAQTISGGRFVLGLGAGAAPGNRFAAEHEALGMTLAPNLADRHRRVAQTLDLLDALWDPARPPRFEGFPRPEPLPPVILGVNSVALASLAGARTDGINVRGEHPRLEQILAAARGARLDRSAAPGTVPEEAPQRAGWRTSVYRFWDDDLLDPNHPDRRRYQALDIDRLVLVVLGPADPDAIAQARPAR